MSAVGGGYNFMGNMPETYNLIVNTNHPLIAKLLTEKDATTQNAAVKQTVDLALLAKGLLKGEELTNFINRSLELMK